MKKIICLVIAICLINHSSKVLAQDSQLTQVSLIQKIGEKFMKDKQAVGLSIGVYTNNNAQFYNFGTINKEDNILPSQNTVYEIGSITKTFVSFILANAVLEYKVSLDDDIRKYLDESYPNLEFNGAPVKLVYLANTTSLLPDWLPELPAEMKNVPADSALLLKIKYYEKLTSKDFFKALHSVKLDTVPGTKRYHSNAGTQLLAYILEGVYKMPMEKLIKKYITVPYKMTGTSFIDSNNKKLTATGYNSSGKEACYEFVMPYFKNAGGLGSNTSDLVNYMKLLLDSTNQPASLSIKKRQLI